MSEVRTGPVVLRVLTWNVHGVRAGAREVAGVLRAARCDVALLQEAPRGLRTLPRTAAVARRAGLHVAAAGRPAVGTAVLVSSRLAPTGGPEVRPLPVRGLRTPGRGTSAVRVALPDGRGLVVASVHLGLSSEERADHVARLQQVLAVPARPGDPLVVGADLNERPGGPSWSTLLPGSLDAWDVAQRQGTVTSADEDGRTFPTRAPRARIDAVLVRGAEVGAVTVADGRGASDHHPVVAEVLLGG